MESDATGETRWNYDPRNLSSIDVHVNKGVNIALYENFTFRRLIICRKIPTLQVVII